MEHTSILTPDHGAHDRPSPDPKEVQFDDPVSFIRVTYRSRNDSKAAASPKPTPAYVTVHKARTWSTVHSLQAAQQVRECPFKKPQLL